MGNLTLFDQIRHDAGHFLNGDIRIGSVLVIQINVIRTQPCQRCFHRRANDLRPGIRNQRLVDLRAGHIEVDTELGGNRHPIPERLQRCAHQLLVIMGIVRRSVDFRRIKEGIAHVHSLGHQLCHLLFVGRCAVGVAHAHAA